MLAEVRAAISKMKQSKSPGIDNITAEEIQAANEGNGLLVMWQLLRQVYGTETKFRFLTDRRKAVIVHTWDTVEKIVRILEKMHKATFSAIRLGGGVTDWFETI